MERPGKTSGVLLCASNAPHTLNQHFHLDLPPRLRSLPLIIISYHGQTVRLYLALLLSVSASAAVAEKDYTPLPLAPETTEVACDPQPSDDEKLRKAIAFFIKPRTVDPREPLGDGYIDSSIYTSADTAFEAQPDCCHLLYKDAELYGSEILKARLGENFGGFVRIKFAHRMLAGPEAGNTYYDNDYYVLDSCGNPVFDL